MVLYLLLITKYKKIANIIVVEDKPRIQCYTSYYRINNNNIFDILKCDKHW